MIRLNAVVLPAPFGPISATRFVLAHGEADILHGTQPTETLVELADNQRLLSSCFTAPAPSWSGAKLSRVEFP